jgi:hypothetical protein
MDSGSGAGFGIGTLFVALIAYIISTIPLYIIGKKQQHEYAWLAFVPIANVWLMCDLAGKDWWWMLLLLIPLINIIVLIMIWMAIAESMNMPSWIGILIIVPFIGIFVPYYIAFASQGTIVS